jgi:hypothetical protein
MVDADLQTLIEVQDHREIMRNTLKKGAE